MLVLAATGFGIVLIGLIILISDSGSWVGTTGRIIMGSGVVILFATIVVARRLRKNVQRNLKRK